MIKDQEMDAIAIINLWWFFFFPDEDECETGKHDCAEKQMECKNLIGMYMCICGPGYQRRPDGEGCVGKRICPRSCEGMRSDIGFAARVRRKTQAKPTGGDMDSESSLALFLCG